MGRRARHDREYSHVDGSYQDADTAGNEQRPGIARSRTRAAQGKIRRARRSLRRRDDRNAQRNPRRRTRFVGKIKEYVLVHTRIGLSEITGCIILKITYKHKKDLKGIPCVLCDPSWLKTRHPTSALRD